MSDVLIRVMRTTLASDDYFDDGTGWGDAKWLGSNGNSAFDRLGSL